MNNNLQRLGSTNVYAFAKIIDSTVNILQEEKKRGRIIGGKIYLGLIELDAPQNLVIVGDLHGDLRTFESILQEIDYENFLSNYKNKIIFLGDYVDRGSDSIGVLYTICYLKQKYPSSVILMRGNHEAHAEFPFLSHDLPLKIRECFGENYEKVIHAKISSLFELLYLVTIVQGKLLLVHGGFPTEIGNKDFKKLIETAQLDRAHNRTLEELLWNDPRANIQNMRDWEISRRAYGRHFGANISKEWLTVTETKVIVRGHEPCHGFKIDHDNRVLTLFSCKETYPKFEAAYIFISKKQLESIHSAMDLVCYVRKLDQL